MVLNKDQELTWLQKLATKIIQQGSIPKHMAFIMDGNRRFAQSNGLELKEGHRKGYEKLVYIWNWAKQVGIKEMTVYAFSIENFKRNKEELDALLDLFREKFSEILQEKEDYKRRGISFRMIGRLSLLPKDLEELLVKVEEVTKNNNKFRLNVALAYTARDDITQSMKTILGGVERQEIRICDIDEDLIEKCLYTKHCQPLDIVIRTSGESRLSDFLLWEQSSSVLLFTNSLWPSVSFWNMLAAVFYYQMHHKRITETRAILKSCRLIRDTDSELNINNFLKKNEKHFKTGRSICSYKKY